MRRLVSEFLKAPFFWQAPPKSTDGPTMIQLFEKALERSTREPGPPVRAEALLATAAVVTGCAILMGVQLTSGKTDQVILSGGGVHNAAVRRSMDLVLTSMQSEVMTVDVLGIPSSSKEALAFALLGAATLDGVSSNVPSATGAKRAVVLGSVTPVPF